MYNPTDLEFKEAIWYFTDQDRAIGIPNFELNRAVQKLKNAHAEEPFKDIAALERAGNKLIDSLVKKYKP